MKRAPSRLFRKEYLAHGEWVPDGQSWTYNGGAAGVDRFTRIRSRRRKRK